VGDLPRPGVRRGRLHAAARRQRGQEEQSLHGEAPHVTLIDGSVGCVQLCMARVSPASRKFLNVTPVSAMHSCVAAVGAGAPRLAKKYVGTGAVRLSGGSV